MTSQTASGPPTIGLSLWERDESVALTEHTIGSLLEQQVQEHGDALALVGVEHGAGVERRLTYRELYAEARRVAQGLLRLTSPGGFVALWAPNVIEWPVIQYGCALAGVTLVAVNPVLPAHDLKYALNHSRSTVLIHADRSRDYDLAEIVASVRGDCPSLRAVVSLSDWAEWTREVPSDPLPQPDPNSAAMLHYTSGTTGTPKGVLLRHRSVVNVARLTVETAGVEPGSVCLNPLPMFHTAACVIGTLGPLWFGGCVVLPERFTPESALDLIERENITVLFHVPTVLGALLETARDSERAVPTLRTAMGGAAVTPSAMIEEAERVFGAKAYNLFGQTELAPVLCMTRVTDSRADVAETVGRPLPQVDCKIVDPVTGEVQPLGRSGEICARGYQQMIAYLHDPEETARTVDADGWVHTGDLGSMDERGVITLAGRLKELIIRGGENIAPAEVEACLFEHQAVDDVAVLGVPDSRWGESVAAVLRFRGDVLEGVREALVAHCRSRLAQFKVPEQWFVTDELPVTPTGKVRKFKVLEAIDDGRLTPLD